MNYNIGDKESIIKTICLRDVLQFAEVSDDRNPIHIDGIVSKNTRFGRQICHGMLIGSYISAVLGNKLPGIGTIYLEQSLKFIKPVYIGDTVKVEVVIKEIKNNIITLDTDVYNQDGAKVVSGIAVVMVEEC